MKRNSHATERLRETKWLISMTLTIYTSFELISVLMPIENAFALKRILLFSIILRFVLFLLCCYEMLVPFCKKKETRKKLILQRYCKLFQYWNHWVCLFVFLFVGGVRRILFKDKLFSIFYFIQYFFIFLLWDFIVNNIFRHQTNLF